MKKHAISLVLCCCAGILYAQYTDQGNFMLGATFGLSAANSRISHGETSQAQENPTSTLFNISPSLGYFAFDNAVVGISMSYTSSRVRSSEGEKNEDSNLLFGPFARYYLPLAGDMSLFFEGNFGFGNSRNDMQLSGQPQNIRTNMTAFGIGPGLTIFSSNAIGIEALCKYHFSRSNFDTTIGGQTATTTTRTNQFDFSVGLRWYFKGLQKAGPAPGGTRP